MYLIFKLDLELTMFTCGKRSLTIDGVRQNTKGLVFKSEKEGDYDQTHW